GAFGAGAGAFGAGTGGMGASFGASGAAMAVAVGGSGAAALLAATFSSSGFDAWPFDTRSGRSLRSTETITGSSGGTIGAGIIRYTIGIRWTSAARISATGTRIGSAAFGRAPTE